MKFGIVMRDELKACLVGAKIEMFDFFVDYKRLKKLLRHLVRLPRPRACPWRPPRDWPWCAPRGRTD